VDLLAEPIFEPMDRRYQSSASNAQLGSHSGRSQVEHAHQLHTFQSRRRLCLDRVCLVSVPRRPNRFFEIRLYLRHDGSPFPGSRFTRAGWLHVARAQNLNDLKRCRGQFPKGAGTDRLYSLVLTRAGRYAAVSPIGQPPRSSRVPACNRCDRTRRHATSPWTPSATPLDSLATR